LKKNPTKNIEMRLLVIRTSAMGDVALTIPVLSAMRRQYPAVDMVVLTRPAFGPFFTSLEGLHLFYPDFNGRHKGLTGIFRLYRDIKRQEKINRVIDLHSVLRSRLLSLFFSLSGVPVSAVDKGRREKRRLVSGKDKHQLKHSVDRYCDTFAKAGFPVYPEKRSLIVPSQSVLTKVSALMGPEDELNIGVAPFARHKLKMWPENYMWLLLKMINDTHKCMFWLFGGREDSEKLKAFQAKIPRSVNLEGTLNLEEELALMSKLDLMIAMDSSNMHMAALTGTKVISIWGGTDPLSGFGAWMQDESLSIRIPVDELTCRPCTVYGKGECKRGDFACMNWLTPEKVFERIKKLIVKI
jgi:ADP-heptose:LPS heptosyltransferase